MSGTVVRDLVFKRVGERSLMLDLYLPSGSSQLLPLVVWVCGGGWTTMGKQHGEGMAAWLTGYGLAVASIEYRVSSEAIFPAQIQDCKAAVRWLRAHADAYGLDVEHVGAMGDSAGGHLVELLGTTAGLSAFEQDGVCPEQSSAVQAVCAFYGPSDLADLPNAEQAVTNLLGAPAAEQPKLAAWGSPLHYVGPQTAPHLFVHGDADTLVPVRHSLRLAKALRGHGVEAGLHIIPGAGHGGGEFRASDEVKRLVADFFLSHLKP